MIQQTVQATIKPVFFGHREIDTQQFIHRALEKPLPVQAQFTAGSKQPIHHQQLQHFLPTDRFAALRQALAPKAIQLQLPPRFTGQPAVAEGAGTPQLHAAQSYLQRIDSLGRKGAIVRKQTQIGGALPVFIKDLQRLAPRRFLFVVDLAQIQNRALYGLARMKTPVLDHTEVAMSLAVLDPVGAAKKHKSSSMPDLPPQR